MAQMYGLTAAEADLVKGAATLAQAVAAPAAGDVDARGRYPEESISALAERGLLGLCVSTDFGGMGQRPHVFAAIVEELAQACGSSAMVFVMHVSAAQAIAASQTLSVRKEVLRDVAAGRHLTTLALSERGSRSQFWAPVSKLVADGDGYSTAALKSWVTSAGHADSYVSSAQAPQAASPLESALYLARPSAAGVHIVSRFDGLGLRGNDSAPVQLENLPVARGDLLTAPGDGAPMMLEVILPWFCVGTAAMANGLCRGAVAATGQHLAATGFEHDGRKLRDLPILRARLAQMSVRTEASRALLGHTLDEMLAPGPMTPLYVLQTRLAAIEAAVEVTDLGLKACGGAAFSKHLPLERLFRDARAGWVMAPTVDHLQDFIGRALTGLPLFDPPNGKGST
jgi:alkylation response protein AidB-like acyl-CoA dehydrogenase